MKYLKNGLRKMKMKICYISDERWCFLSKKKRVQHQIHERCMRRLEFIEDIKEKFCLEEE